MGSFSNGDILNYKIWLGDHAHTINMVFSSPEAYLRYNETKYGYPDIKQIHRHEKLTNSFRSIIGLKKDIDRLFEITSLSSNDFTDKYYGYARLEPYGPMGFYGIVGAEKTKTSTRSLFLLVPAADIYAAYLNYHTWEPRYQNNTYTENRWIATFISQGVSGGLAAIATASSYIFGVKVLVVYSLFHVLFEGANLGLTYWSEDQTPNTYNDATNISFGAAGVGIFMSLLLQSLYVLGVGEL